MRFTIYAFVFLLCSAAQAQTIPREPHIVINGKASKTLKPDMFELPITVYIGSKDASTADKVQLKVATLVSQLKSAGIANADLEVDNLVIEKLYDDNDRFEGNGYRQDIRANFTIKEV